MDNKIILTKQDLTYLRWTHKRASSRIAGSFLKSESSLNGSKTYFKLSNYDNSNGIVGHECINEIIIDRLLTILGVEHLEYQLVHADIEVDGKIIDTYICASRDFKKKNETKAALDSFYEINSLPKENHYEFCVRYGWEEYIDRMLAVDYIILNRDRHGANIEILKNHHTNTFRPAPLFDHGLSLLYSCTSLDQIKSFEVMNDTKCNNYIGSFSCEENLNLINTKGNLFNNKLLETDKEKIFKDIEKILPEEHISKIWEMIYRRYKYYESLQHI